MLNWYFWYCLSVCVGSDGVFAYSNGNGRSQHMQIGDSSPTLCVNINRYFPAVIIIKRFCRLLATSV